MVRKGKTVLANYSISRPLSTAKIVEFFALLWSVLVTMVSIAHMRVFVFHCFMEFDLVAMQAHRHGGEIRVVSEPGKGTTLSVLLPAAG